MIFTKTKINTQIHTQKHTSVQSNSVQHRKPDTVLTTQRGQCQGKVVCLVPMLLPVALCRPFSPSAHIAVFECQ